jgi:cytochrome c556
MLKAARVLSAAAVALVAAGLFLAPARGRDDEDKEKKEKAMKTAAAQVDVLKLAASLGGAEDDVKKQAGEVAKKHDIEFVMNQFKPRGDGGVGVGPMPGVFPFDAIEGELLFLSKKPLPPAQLAAQKADLQKMAEVTLAVAYTAPSYAPKQDEPGKPVKDWLKFSDDMKKHSKGLIDALTGGDAKMVQSAAGWLNSSCNNCHSEFRDNG